MEAVVASKTEMNAEMGGEGAKRERLSFLGCRINFCLRISDLLFVTRRFWAHQSIPHSAFASLRFEITGFERSFIITASIHPPPSSLISPLLLFKCH